MQQYFDTVLDSGKTQIKNGGVVDALTSWVVACVYAAAVNVRMPCPVRSILALVDDTPGALEKNVRTNMTKIRTTTEVRALEPVELLVQTAILHPKLSKYQQTAQVSLDEVRTKIKIAMSVETHVGVAFVVGGPSSVARHWTCTGACSTSWCRRSDWTRPLSLGT